MLLENLFMECTHVHVQSDMKNIYVRQNIHFFITVNPNLCINKNVVGIPLIIEHMHIFLVQINIKLS